MNIAKYKYILYNNLLKQMSNSSQELQKSLQS